MTNFNRAPDSSPLAGAACPLSATGDAAASTLGKLSWLAFETGRNPYQLLITIFLFAPYFANTVVGDPVRGQAFVGAVASYSGFCIAILAPLLGAIADAGGRRKPWIALFAIVLFSVELLMWQVKPGATGAALVFGGGLIAIGGVSFEFSSVFHNAMLASIAPKRELARLSGHSLGLAAFSGFLLLLFMLVALALPGTVDWWFVPARPLFGIDRVAHEQERLAGPISAIWLALWSAPLFLFTPDRASTGLSLRASVASGLRSVLATVKSLNTNRNVGLYLLSRLFFNDGLTAAITFNGIFAASVFHWGTVQMLAFGIECCLCGAFGGFLGSWLDHKLGTKGALILGIAGTLCSCMVMLTFAPDRIFWFFHYDIQGTPLWSTPIFNTWPQLLFLLVTDIGAILATAVYGNARTMLAHIAPAEQMTQFFGLFSLSGMSTTFLATGFVAWLTAATSSQRLGLLGTALFFTLGLCVLVFVKDGSDPL